MSQPSIQTWVGGDEPIEDEFEPVTNRDDLPHKPAGGLWTSTAFIKNGHTTSDWVEWLDRNQQYKQSQVVYELQPAEREYDILTIDSYQQLRDVIATYNRKPESDAQEVRTNDFFPLIDFEAIGEDYDAIHLTEDGQHKTRLTVPGLYGWDAESYLWFDWVFVDMIGSTPITDIVE